MNKETIPQGLFKTPFGNFWLPTTYFDPVLMSLRSGQHFEPYVVEACNKFIKPESTVIDIGGNFGCMTLTWSKLVGPIGSVHSFECSDFVRYFLKKSVDLNDFAYNVTIHENAVWHTPNIELKMLIPSPNAFYSGAGIFGENDDRKNEITTTVISTTIDSFEYDKPVSLIKSDVQGSDLFALQGAINTIKKYKPAICVEYEEWYDHKFNINIKQLFDLMHELNYEARPDIINNNHDFFFTSKV